MTERPEVHIHIHIDPTGDAQAILDALTNLEITMSDLSGAEAANTQAIADLSARIDAEVSNLNASVASFTDLYNQALATDTADQAKIADLQAQLAAVVGSIQASTTAISAIAQPPAPPAF